MSRAERRAEVVRHAADLELDGVLVFSWRRSAMSWLSGYAPGFVTNQAAMWLPVQGEPVVGVRFPFEVTRAAAESGLPATACADPAGLVPAGVRRIGLIAGDLAVDELTTGLAGLLAGRGIEVVDLRAWAEDRAEVKTADEVLRLTRAARIADSALRGCGLEAPVDWTDFEIAAAVEAVARRAGAMRVTCLVGIGRGAVVTECSGRRVGTGDGVGLELTLYADGACMHANAQLLPSAPGEDDLVADRVCRETRRVVVEALRAGSPVDDVVAAGDEVLARHGLLAFKEYDFGHGLGSDTPQHPRLISGTGRTLTSGAVVAAHVAVRTPGGPTGFVGGPVLIGPDGASELLPEALWTSS